ncbi:sulfatase [Blastopirellula sp. J2-11]|uniref:sulfatase n=1 Tax=Blastopirellula sp. J2-11 TaxID=2943192 RepID=UPI0021CA567A|nr:sulfatase [Blastopirellula sp. J2-11]UUO04318.1 sulfatase [Blastopirellula sp. J2-11]
MSRRFRYATMILGLAILFIPLILSRSAAAAQKPNIVLIFADDQGWKDIGYQGRGFIETPNLDRLAAESMVFTSGYASAGNCAPSRACLISGNYTPRHDVYAVFSTERGKKREMRLTPVPNKSGLAKQNVTMAEALQAAGYVTGHFGKWHLAGPEGALPSEQGFDVTFDSFGEGELREGSEGNQKGPTEDAKGVFTLTRKACEFIEANQHRPFFCYLAHHAIHSPLQGRAETLEKFQAKSSGKHDPSPMYAACTYDMDASVGMLLEKLDELHLTENTLLVYTSDNGATQSASQEPLRGGKGGYYEGGIREPLIVRWPGVTQPGGKSDVPVINVDFYPTFLEAAGAKVPAGKILDGESLLPLLSGEGRLKRTGIFWHFPGYLDRPVIRGRELDVRTGFRSRPVSVIRKGDWKLHLFHEEWQLDGGRENLTANHAVELYNLADDIGERHDLATVETDKRDDLLNDLLAWLQASEAKIPLPTNPKFAPVSRKDAGK